MYEWLQQQSFGPELICLMGGVIAAFMMALLRSFSLNRKTVCMKLADSLMLSMFMLSLLIIIGKGFNFWDMWWAVVLGTIVGYFGLAGLHQIIAVALGIAVTTQLGSGQTNKLGPWAGPVIDHLIKMLKQSNDASSSDKDKSNDTRN